MNSGLLKLAIVGSGSAYGRLAGIAGGVAIAVCLLLLLWGGANGLSARDDRGAWLRETGGPSVSVPVAAGDPSASGPATPVPLSPDTASGTATTQRHDAGNASRASNGPADARRGPSVFA